MQVIRPYARTDLAEMVTLDAVCFAPEFLFHRSSMRRFAESPHAAAFVAEASGGPLVGFVIVHLERRPSGMRGYVVTLDVAPAHRRTGLAGRLMRRVEDQAAAKGVPTMELHVSVQNETAIRFYEGRGYRRITVDEGFYGSGSDAYLYQKALQTTCAD